MAMTFTLHDNFDLNGAEGPFEISPAPPAKGRRAAPKNEEIHLFAEKMTVPVFEDYLARRRLDELLDKNLKQFNATLLTGRAGSGKTALAADFSRKYRCVAWLFVESAENDWEIFARYFLESFGGILKDGQKGKFLKEIGRMRPQGIASYVENLLSRVRTAPDDKPFLIVIDGIHNVFDAGWFAEFFTTLLYALTPDAHLVMLSRSNPPLPLWRLRSKQVLGVIDEKLLAFTRDETGRLLKKFGLPEEKTPLALGKTFGRISRLKEFIERAKR